MKFSIAVYTSPTASEQALTALQFAESVIEQGHEIYRLFFFNEGVLNGVALPAETAGEASLYQAWQQLIQNHELDAVVCVSSAKKRGIVGQDAASQGSAADPNALPCLRLADGFTIGGLGQFIDASVNSDRMITFGH